MAIETKIAQLLADSAAAGSPHRLFVAAQGGKGKIAISVQEILGPPIGYETLRVDGSAVQCYQEARTWIPETSNPVPACLVEMVQWVIDNVEVVSFDMYSDQLVLRPRRSKHGIVSQLNDFEQACQEMYQGLLDLRQKQATVGQRRSDKDLAKIKEIQAHLRIIDQLVEAKALAKFMDGSASKIDKLRSGQVRPTENKLDVYAKVALMLQQASRQKPHWTKVELSEWISQPVPAYGRLIHLGRLMENCHWSVESVLAHLPAPDRS